MSSCLCPQGDARANGSPAAGGRPGLESDVARLKNTFAKTASEAGRILKNLGYAPDDIGRVVKDVYGLSGTEIAGLLKNALGFSDRVVGLALIASGCADEVLDATR